MSSKTINDLCEDALLLIFDKYLDLRSQLTAQRVCRRFRHLIDDIFDAKRALYLTEDSKHLYEICDEEVNKYSVLSVQPLSRLRDGLWVRGERGGLRLLQPLDIQMLALKKHKCLTALCLVMTSRSPLESLIDLILHNCPSNLEKLIVINLNGNHFSLNTRQMSDLCRQYSNLKHFEIFSDYLYASEECFEILMNRCQRLEVFKLNVRHIFTEDIESLGAANSRSVTYNSYAFSGTSFAQTSGRLTTIHASNPIINESLIVNRLPLMADRFVNVKHLSVESLSPNSMQTICNIFRNVENFSFSMQYSIELNGNQIKSLIASISQLEKLTKLCIRWFTRYQTEGAVPIDYNTLKGLKNCSNLSHLAIKEAVLGDQSLKDINNLVPSLRSLRIIDCTLNRNSFSSLIHFNKLKELFVLKSYSDQTYLKFTINRMDGQTVKDIIDNCVDFGLIDSPKRKLDIEEPEIYADNNEEPIVVVEPQMGPNVEQLIPNGRWDLENDFEFFSNLEAMNWNLDDLEPPHTVDQHQNH